MAYGFNDDKTKVEVVEKGEGWQLLANVNVANANGPIYYRILEDGGVRLKFNLDFLGSIAKNQDITLVPSTNLPEYLKPKKIADGGLGQVITSCVFICSPDSITVALSMKANTGLVLTALAAMSGTSGQWNHVGIHSEWTYYPVIQ